MGKICEILRYLFGKAKPRVKWNSKIGDLFENTCGVLQGGTIIPTLFNAYIEDMQPYFAGETGVSIGGLNINHLLLADDLIIISEIISGLQNYWINCQNIVVGGIYSSMSSRQK